MINRSSPTGAETLPSTPAPDLAEASLEDQRAALVAQAAALGLTVLDPQGIMPGVVEVRVTGRSADVFAALDLLRARGIGLDSVSPQKSTRGRGVAQYAQINMAHPDNQTARRYDMQRAAVEED